MKENEKLVDIQSIRVDTSKPPDERIKAYLQRVKNPYHFLYGNTAVHIRFASGGSPLSQILKDYLIQFKEM